MAIYTRNIFSRPALGAGFAVALIIAFSLLFLPSNSRAQALFTHNSNAAVSFDAGRIELQQRQDRVVLSGGADLQQAGLRLRASRVTVAFRDVGTTDISRIDAVGGVDISKGDTRAQGQTAIYDLNRRIITMIGNVRLNRGGDVLTGERLTIDLTTGISSVDGRGANSGSGASSSGNGRVSGSFSVPQRGDAQDAAE
jgi:lipopolysaccharide export system protein LptA